MKVRQEQLNQETALGRFPTSTINALNFGYWQATGGSEKATCELQHAARIGVFYRLGGLLATREWKQRVRPRLKLTEDWIEALFELFPLMGWGIWELVQVVPDEQLIVRVKGGYEGEGYLRQVGVSKRGGVCFFATALAAGIMNMIYATDVTQGGKVSERRFLSLFESPGGFTAEEIDCQAEGKDSCKIIVTKRK